jgi:hypothetical protein
MTPAAKLSLSLSRLSVGVQNDVVNYCDRSAAVNLIEEQVKQLIVERDEILQ